MNRWGRRQVALGLFLLLYGVIQGAPNLQFTTEPSEEQENQGEPTPLYNRPTIEEGGDEDEEVVFSGQEVMTTLASGVPTQGSTDGGTAVKGHPTYRPKKSNCTPAAIEQFPRPMIGPWARKHGALIIHIAVCVYSFIGLAIICDDYFVTSLDSICQALKLTPDVAGATFMAAGSSAPELATVVIGVFFAQDDIGVSGVIGSAVFNIMFVISVCGLCTSTVSYLNWWPLCRDSFAYMISILIMLFVIIDDVITWGESLFMLLAYVGYCVALGYNPVLERWANTLPIPCTKPEFQAMMDEEKRKGGVVGGVVGAQPPQGENQQLVSYKNLQEKHTYSSTADGEESYQQEQMDQQQHANLPNGVEPVQRQYYKATNLNLNQTSPLVKPETQDKLILFKWFMCYPIHLTAQKSMPDLKEEKYKNWYPFNFIISMIWISFYSFIMVWMITVIGSTLGIPDTVMGLTFVAAGVSVPDALSSLAVVKEGYGDMAVSNAVGSNVFDILICLGLPWFLQTAVILPGSHAHVYSKGLTYSTLSLLSTVLFLVVATHMNNWKLDKRYGMILMVWYLLFILFASLYELNVFGQLNPPECISTF